MTDNEPATDGEPTPDGGTVESTESLPAAETGEDHEFPSMGEVKRWFVTTNHKDVGILYLITGMFFFLFGGVLALLMRLQLWAPRAAQEGILSAMAYNQSVSLHGLIMVFWFISPFATGFANYIVPLQVVGADLERDEVVGEAERKGREEPEDHDEAVGGHRLVVGAAGHHLRARLQQLEPDHQRQRAAEQKEEKRCDDVEDADVLVVGRDEPPPDRRGGRESAHAPATPARSTLAADPPRVAALPSLWPPDSVGVGVDSSVTFSPADSYQSLNSSSSMTIISPFICE